MEHLPEVFALSFLDDRWFVETPAFRSFDRKWIRQELSPAVYDLLTIVTDDAPTAPQLDAPSGPATKPLQELCR